MDDNMLVINYPNGRMVLDMRQFFPASGVRVRKLFKGVVGLIWDSRDKAEIAQRVMSWLNVRAEECSSEDLLRAFASTSVEAHTRASEMQEEIDRKSAQLEKLKDYMTNFVPSREKKRYREETLKPAKEELSLMKQGQKDLYGKARFYQNEFNKAKSLAEKYKQNRELVEQLAEEGGYLDDDYIFH